MIDISEVTFDEHGLVPAILVDAESGEVLMMAWMNTEALVRTLTSGLATFWSRSRQEIWLKGATSGHYMHVRDIQMDCDGDTLLLRVQPDGAACHTGSRTCFFREVPALSRPLLVRSGEDAEGAEGGEGSAEGALSQDAFVSDAAESIAFAEYATHDVFASDSSTEDDFDEDFDEDFAEDAFAGETFVRDETEMQEALVPGAFTSDFHMHSTFSDGTASLRMMIEAAEAAGLKRIGFADHSHTTFDTDYCMAPDDYLLYQATVRVLAREYASRIEVLCGMEQDYYSDWALEGVDYAVGSVHYVRVGGENANTVVTVDNPEGEYLAMDLDLDALSLGIDKYFDGDAYALCEKYFELEADLVRKTGCSIIGHFDLVKMFNGVDEDGHAGSRFFDEHHPRYVAAWQRAADALLATGVLFEINVNGVAKGRTAEPYPSPEIVEYLRERGARFVISSDAHGTSYLRRHDRRPELAIYGL